MNQLLVQCAEIVRNGEILICDEKENTVFQQEVNNTNYIHFDLKLPKGHYQLELLEEGKTTKKNFKL